ncbi:prophage protein [Escherichia coli]|nr:prophage protein [Escherichia coli]
MNTLTKEWLQNTITSIESARDEIPFGLDEDQNNMLTALKIALASLAAVSDERAAYELFMEKRFGESVDRRRAKNGDREYMAWDMALGWIIWCHRAAMLQGSQPVSQTYNLPELIEGMEVSIDVSTCDADLGNRYFGTITEALELDTAKNGYILLVQDAEPNFDVNGNSPGTPDSWISCSDQMPDDGQHVIILCDGAFVLYAQYRDGEFFDIVRNGDEFFETQSRNVTDWMPLPEPPQEVK